MILVEFSIRDGSFCKKFLIGDGSFSEKEPSPIRKKAEKWQNLNQDLYQFVEEQM